jgi:uncharacterized protein RhaS with RHS repeats
LGRFISRDPLGEEGGMNLYAYVGNDSVNAVDPFGLITIGIPGIGPQRAVTGKSSNSDFNKAITDMGGQLFSRDQLNAATDAIKKAHANGDNCVNIYGCSRGGYAALKLVAMLANMGISVNTLVTIDPVLVPGDNRDYLSVPSSVLSATNYYHQGPRQGPTDFPGTRLNDAPNVYNRFLLGGSSMRDRTVVRHENMPYIVFHLR